MYIKIGASCSLIICKKLCVKSLWPCDEMSWCVSYESITNFVLVTLVDFSGTFGRRCCVVGYDGLTLNSPVCPHVVPVNIYWFIYSGQATKLKVEKSVFEYWVCTDRSGIKTPSKTWRDKEAAWSVIGRNFSKETCSLIFELFNHLSHCYNKKKMWNLQAPNSIKEMDTPYIFLDLKVNLLALKYLTNFS